MSRSAFSRTYLSSLIVIIVCTADNRKKKKLEKVKDRGVGHAEGL